MDPMYEGKVVLNQSVGGCVCVCVCEELFWTRAWKQVDVGGSGVK